MLGAVHDEAPDLLFHHDYLVGHQSVMMVRSGDPYLFRPGDSLAGRKLGLAAGYHYEVTQEFERHHRGTPSLRYYLDDANGSPAQKMLLALVGREVDTIIDSQTVLEFNLRRLGLQSQLRVAGVVNEPFGLYVAVRPDHPDAGDILDRIDSGLRAIRVNGKFAHLLYKYGLTDWARRDDVNPPLLPSWEEEATSSAKREPES